MIDAGEIAVARAVVRIAELWRLSEDEQAGMLSVGVNDVKSIRSDKTREDLIAINARAAGSLVRLYESLGDLFGDDHAAASRWLRTPNLDLNQTPVRAAESLGLAAVCDYVDSYRQRC